MKFKILTLPFLAASSISFAAIEQSLGLDQRVDYTSLTKYGPWDDRNYNVTKEDLDLLPADDQYLANVPVFFKIEKRKELPDLGKFYPRSTLQHFQILHGGLIVDGIWYKDGLGKGYHPEPVKEGKVGGVSVKGAIVTADFETPLANGVFGNEVTIECNPTNPNICVAGSNQSAGQTMYYSTDGAETWNISQTNASSCCDPTVDWSSDGSIVYQADLSASTGVRWTRSLDQGVTWEPMKTLTNSGSDKEWIHVDRSLVSPYKDNVYLTYHNSNIMQFAKSTDMGQTMSVPIAFNGEEAGIGSDIATDSQGNIYYVYAGVQGGGIKMLKSTDGGDSFAPGVQVAPLTGIFDFPIPAMETREVFIYVSVDIDSNDNIYVAFTDEADDSFGNGNGSASQNRAVIKVAKSTNGGNSWTLLPMPHADDGQLNSGNPIDRFHPWLMVGENNAVHVGFYDTRNSVNRTGVDFYYNVSTDGGASWLPQGEQRYSTETSVNINNGQEWGDYNGLSVVMENIAMTWTDNRNAQQTAMVGTSGNLFGPTTFNITPTPDALDVCANDLNNAVTLDITSVMSYSGTVSMIVDSAPGFVNNTAFSANNQVAPFSSNFTFDVDNTGANGPATITIEATGDEMGDIQVKTTDITVNYSSGVPAGTNLTLPVNAATGVSTGSVQFGWDAILGATSYLIEISDDNGFNNIVDSAVVANNAYQSNVGLTSNTEYFWRVTATNGCGVGSSSSTFSFTTANEICAAVPASIPDDTPLGIDVSLNVGISGIIDSMQVQVDSDHTWPGDLIFTLTNESTATSIVLMDRPGVPDTQYGCSQGGIEVTFDDNSGTPIENVCENTSPGITGTLQPEEALAAFNGEEVNGNWTLNASDILIDFTGNITKFCLLPQVALEDPCDPPSPVNDPDVIFRNGFQCIQQNP